jgi:hypothetical protein
MDPMPSGAVTHQGSQGADAAVPGAGGGAEGPDMGRVAAMGEARAAAPLAAPGGARAGAQAAMHPAAAIAHGRLAAGAAGAGACAATGRGQEVAGAGAVLQPAAPVGRQAGGRGQRRKRATESMPGGE